MSNYCPACRSTEYTAIGKPRLNLISREFVDKDYLVVQCNNCKVYYVSPEINFTDEQWSRLYNSEYFAMQSNILIKRRHKELVKRFERAEKLRETNGDVKFLDIGAGEGKTLIAGLERDWDVTGIDIVDNRIPEAKNDKINFIRGKFIEYDFPENYFDFIYLDSVLEHVLNPKEYLEKIRQILKPGGIIYIGVPNEDSLFNDVRRIIFNLTGKKDISVKIKPFDTPYHVIGFNNRSLRNIIGKAGLKIKYSRNFGRKFSFLNFPITNRGFWIDLLFLFPVETIGYIIHRDVYFEAYITKQNIEI